MSALGIIPITILLAAAPAEGEPAAPQPLLKRLSPAGAGSCSAPSWARDGHALAYERVFSQARRIELHVLHDPLGPQPSDVRVKMPRFRRRAGQRFTGKDENGAVCRELSWGPKHQPDVYAYSCNRDGAFQVYWSGGMQVTQGSSSSGQPALSPVGWRMACVQGGKGSGALAYVPNLMKDASTQPLLRALGRVDLSPRFSPDGKALLFVGHSKRNAALYLISNLDQPKAVQLTRGRRDALSPSWSPDGSQIAYFLQRRGTADHYDLYVRDRGKGKARRVASDVIPSEQQGPAWTPDGAYLVYVKNIQRGRKVDPLRVVSVDGHEDHALPTGTVSNRSPAIAEVDGRVWVAFSALGTHEGGERTWRKIYAYPLDLLEEQP